MSESARTVEVLVVGGGPAGLSAALTLGHARRSVRVTLFTNGQLL